MSRQPVTYGVDAARDPSAHAELTLRLAGALHHWVARFDDRTGACWELAGQPGVAWFTRDGNDTIAHRSVSLPEDVAPVLAHLVGRHCDLQGLPPGGNSHALALVLAAMFLADRTSLESLGAAGLIRRPARLQVLDEEQGRHDPPLEAWDGALRVWVPVLDQRDESSIDPWPTVLDVAFSSGRSVRYVPWEGAQGASHPVPAGRS